MGLAFRLFGRPLLAFQDSERAHSRALKLLRLFSSNPLTRLPMKLLYKPKKTIPIQFLGDKYDHPLGLAAGMDNEIISDCLSDGDMAQALVDLYQINAERDKISSTPSFLINGEKMDKTSYSDFVSKIDEHLKGY